MIKKISIGLLVLILSISLGLVGGLAVKDHLTLSREKERAVFTQCFQTFGQSPTEILSCIKVVEKMNDLK